MICGDCTLCCTLLEVKEFNKRANQHCEHCEVGSGCKIWEDRPNVCREFQCAYTQMEIASINLRPDKCGVIFEKVTDTIFIGTVDPKLKRFTEPFKQQVKKFVQQGIAVILFKKDMETPFIYATRFRTPREIWVEFQNEIRNKHGISTILN